MMLQLDMITLEVQMENRCVVCGAIIPEGRQVCPNCMEGFVPEQEQEMRCLEELIRRIELILIKEGQQDKRFKWGDFIKYAPYEVAEILRKHFDELQT